MSTRRLHIHTAVGSGIAHCCRNSVDVQTQKDRNPGLCVRVPAGQLRLVPFSRFFHAIFFPDLRIPGQNPPFPPSPPVEFLEFLCFNILPIFLDHLPIGKRWSPTRSTFFPPARRFLSELSLSLVHFAPNPKICKDSPCDADFNRPLCHQNSPVVTFRSVLPPARSTVCHSCDFHHSILLSFHLVLP